MSRVYEINAADLEDLVANAGQAWRTRAQTAEADAIKLRAQVQQLTNDGKALQDRLWHANNDVTTLRRQLADAESLLLLR
jgi:ElaB/YqjD/DUF883 family membrane-anchored ribosome-binding protein